MKSPISLAAVRETFAVIGILPFLLMGIGAILYWKNSRWWWLPAWGGILWSLWLTLYAKREINATVTAGDPILSYPGV